MQNTCKISRKIRIAFVVFLLSMFLFYAQADFDLTKWRYRAPLFGSSGSNLNKTGFAAFLINADLFSHLNPSISDLRIRNENGEVSYAIAVEGEQKSYVKVPVRMFNLSSVRGGATTFILDIGKAGIFHNSLEIETSSENFRRMVEIEGSNDQSSWRVLNSKGQIFDYTVRDIKSVKVQDTKVSYPDTNFRYLRVKIINNNEPPLEVSGVRVWREVVQSAREIAYQPAFRIEEDPADKTTNIVLDFGASGVPHRKVRLFSNATNFSRAVNIYSSSDGMNWRFISQDYIYSISAKKFSGSRLEFSYPETNRRYLKISILNFDDQPISVNSIKVFGIVRRVIFKYEPGKTYFVYAGNPQASRPKYDIEKILPYADLSSIDYMQIGSLEENPNYTPPVKPLTERWPYLLPAVLVLIIALLAFLLIRIFVKFKLHRPPFGNS